MFQIGSYLNSLIFNHQFLIPMNRNRTLDLARSFTVFFIAPEHAVLLFSQPYVYHTLFGRFLFFIAEGPDAQLFYTADEPTTALTTYMPVPNS